MIKTIYNKTIRKYLPVKYSIHNGVTAKKEVKLFDKTDTFPEYKNELLYALNNVNKGDTIVNIGSGYGVSTVKCSQAVKETGRVISYEGAKEYIEKTKETIGLNYTFNNIFLHHNIIGENIDVWGELGEIKSPKELPECELLILDCEGAETNILENLEIRPNIISVETHKQFGVNYQYIEYLLEINGYDTRLRRRDGKNDWVITAYRK